MKKIFYRLTKSIRKRFGLFVIYIFVLDAHSIVTKRGMTSTTLTDIYIENKNISLFIIREENKTAFLSHFSLRGKKKRSIILVYRIKVNTQSFSRQRRRRRLEIFFLPSAVAVAQPLGLHLY